VRLALQVVVQKDGGFVNVILLYSDLALFDSFKPTVGSGLVFIH